MTLKIIINPNKELYEFATQGVKQKSGYCPCLLEICESNKCVCDEFKNQDYEGPCRCGRYVKVSV